MSDTHAQSVAFVRETAIPAAPPPSRERGPIKWMRDNLFSTWLNALLTLAAIYLVYQLAVFALPWILNGLWTTSSLSECRDILQGETGACFAVLTERWNQLLFGFKYPSAFYWRPGLAFILLFIAAAPVLFFDLPRKMLLFTGLYPFLAYWLIWGGPLLAPLTALIGVVAGYLVYARFVKDNFAKGLAAGVVAAVVVWIAGGYLTELLAPNRPILPAVQSRDMGGFMLNLILGTVCVSLSLPIGICLALGRQSNMPIIRIICVVFIEFIRGVPLITLLFVANVVLAYFLPPGTNFDLIIRVIIMITAFASAYIAEVIRGGLAALPKGQYEAGDSLGLDYPQAMRLIILPQALKISIPGIVNVAVGLFKDTTLVSVISMFDLVGMIRGPVLASTEWNGVYWELFSFAALLFFVVCYGISQYSQWLERRLATDHR
ncbi:ABC transporter permease subunit [Aquicoccus sp. SCR17]|nr:ABC transporter permease subunit [Carideicomes alvinocaridis]